MITQTSVKHPTFIKNLLHGLRQAIKYKHWSIKNKKGIPTLFVSYRKGNFIITDSKGNNVRQALGGLCGIDRPKQFTSKFNLSCFITFRVLWTNSFP